MPLDPAILEQIISELTADEGFAATPYFDTVKKLTVGIGRNITDRGFTEDEARAILQKRGFNPTFEILTPPVSTWLVVGSIESAPLTRGEAEMMLATDIVIAEDAVRRILPRFESYSRNRKAALVNMAFNLGASRLLTFRKMLRAIRAGDWDLAAAEALASKWARQVGSRRSGRIAEQLREG